MAQLSSRYCFLGVRFAEIERIASKVTLFLDSEERSGTYQGRSRIIFNSVANFMSGLLYGLYPLKNLELYSLLRTCYVLCLLQAGSSVNVCCTFTTAIALTRAMLLIIRSPKIVQRF